MAEYSYKARNNGGQLITGHLAGASELEVIQQLRQMQYTPIKITQAVASKMKAGSNSFFQFKFGTRTSTKVSVRDMTVFCTNLSSMINAGVPLLGALNMVGEQLTNAHLASTVRKVSQLVSDGSSFSEALEAYPKVFSNFFINMIRAAEASGTIDEVLQKMTVYMEKQETLRQTVKGMMICPIVLVIVSILVVLLIITVVMPQFVQIFLKAGVPLPLPTKIMYHTGLWVKNYWLYCKPVISGVIWGGKAYFKTVKGKDFLDRFVLKLPVLGDLIKKSLVARFTRTLATMLNTGVPMLQGLAIVQKVVENNVFAEIVRDVYLSTEKGEGLYKALLKRKEIPKDVTYMVSVGEKAGNMGTMLNKVADFYESKVQFEVKELMVLIEPMFIMMLGVVVGGIMASMILPMFDMVKTIQR